MDDSESLESDEESEWSELTDDEDNYGDDALTSFRMFCQRLAHEEVESEPEEYLVEEVSIDEIGTDENEPLAEVEAITEKLQRFGITMLDLVAMLTDRKSKLVKKHTDQFIDAMDIIIDNAITNCDKEARDAVAVSSLNSAM